MAKLICKRLTFCSESDENSFFDWLSKIECVERWEALSDEIHLHMRESALADECLRELLTRFLR